MSLSLRVGQWCSWIRAGRLLSVRILALACFGFCLAAASPLLVTTTAALAVDGSETVSLVIGSGTACWVQITPPGAADPGKSHKLAINVASPVFTWTHSGAMELDLCGANKERPARDAIITAGTAGVYTVRAHLP
jgi:hypothetical protein